MTIASETRNSYFNGNGSTTAFPFAGKVFATTDVRVILTSAAGVSTEQTLGSHYSVSLNADQDNNPGGTVTMVTAPASGATLAVLSDLTYTQGLDLQVGGGFNPGAVEGALDRQAILLQQVRADLDRCMRVSDAEQTAQQLDASATVRAGKVLGFDASGNLTVLSSIAEGSISVSSYMEDVVAAANATAAKTLLEVPAPVTAASGISYSNSGTSLAATTVQAAITELDSDVQALGGGSSWVPATATLEVFTSSGTFTVPTGCTHILVEAIGAGGGGGAGENAATGSWAYAEGGTGGEAGGVTHRLLRAPSAGTAVTVTIGTGGSGGATAGARGSAGGYSSFGGYCIGKGGAGGLGGRVWSFIVDSPVPPDTVPAPTWQTAAANAPGAGGFGEGAYNAKTAGQNSLGGQNTISTVNGGAAGGTAAAGSAGSNASTSYTYGGGGGGGDGGTSTGYNGGAGGTPGGGGGGGGAATNNPSGTVGTGGSGARGEVRLWWW